MINNSSRIVHLSDFLNTDGWTINHEHVVPGRSRILFPSGDLPLGESTRRYIAGAFPDGIYKHQHQALALFCEAYNVCLTTGTASGKSLPYYLAALETLRKNERARVLVVYPMKALGREQEDRWRAVLRESNSGVQVGRIDGHVPTSSRIELIKRCKVIIVTPDILHAWLLSNLVNRTVLAFLHSIQLIIVDEVHSYTGVFGSNSAFLFRRIQHLQQLLGAGSRYMGASATVADPQGHLRKLFGVDFELVGAEQDTSPRHETHIRLLTPARQSDSLSELSRLLVYLASNTDLRFLAFVDSRKQAEQLTSITNRQLIQEDEFAGFHDLEKLNVLPFRAGYEERDRDMIQDRLRSGSLRGVVSTSALELGIDIPYLDAAVLVGVPASLTSLYQRIGRIGRHKSGEVLVVNTGSVYDEAVFRNPGELFNRPMAEGALYLENQRVQYIHALCLARPDGEHDQVAAVAGRGSAFETAVDWPRGFWDLCLKERRGEIPIELQAMKADSSGDPNHSYPLRDVESQFKVELRQGPNIEPKGSLSHSQLMREAYPGAVYYCVGQPYRVTRVLGRERTVIVRQEKRYTTTPNLLPTLVYPNLGDGSLHQARKFGDLIVVECNLQVSEAVVGYAERRGNSKIPVSYPTDSLTSGIFFDQPRFQRFFFTTGILIMHPALSVAGTKVDLIAKMIYEAYVMAVPFERQDINFASGKHRTARGVLSEGTPFVAVYDQTYGSLRLSGRLCEDAVLRTVLNVSRDLAENAPEMQMLVESRRAIDEMIQSTDTGPTLITFTGGPIRIDTNSANRVRIIMPGSKGLGLRHDNEEFEVAKVQFHPSVTGLAYRGRYISTTESNVAEFLPIADLAEIPGVSRIGSYDYDLAEIMPDEQNPGEVQA